MIELDNDGIILIDKSFTQSLNESEAKRLNDYNILICPELHSEILGDISKKKKPGKSGASYDQVAKKAPKKAHFSEHAFLYSSLNLLGQHIPMDGRLPSIEDNEIYPDSSWIPQYRIKNWAKRRVFCVEQQNSIQRRKTITQLEKTCFPNMIKILNARGYSERTCNSLEKAKELTRNVLINLEQKELIDLIFRQLQIGHVPHLKQRRQEIYDFCKNKNYMELKINCPYAMYVLELEVFFQIALASKLMKMEGNSLPDCWYLHYLPFCKYFVSSDRFHKRSASIFMKQNQKFFWGPDFREKLNTGD